MLKYVVPVYLIAIFAAFCWQNLPSKEIPAFEAQATLAGNLGAAKLPQQLAEQFAAEHVALPKSPVVSTTGSADEWWIADEKGVPVFVMRLVESTAGGKILSVRQYKIGYVEGIGRNSVTLASVTFILIVLAFLLLLIQIAGRRWKAEGRLDEGGPRP
jgi:hypothetical protein